jgi:hypothetical protein
VHTLFGPEECNYVLDGKWMELEIIMLNEESQPHKDKYGIFSLT